MCPRTHVARADGPITEALRSVLGLAVVLAATAPRPTFRAIVSGLQNIMRSCFSLWQRATKPGTQSTLMEPMSPRPTHSKAWRRQGQGGGGFTRRHPIDARFDNRTMRRTNRDRRRLREPTNACRCNFTSPLTFPGPATNTARLRCPTRSWGPSPFPDSGHDGPPFEYNAQVHNNCEALSPS